MLRILIILSLSLLLSQGSKSACLSDPLSSLNISGNAYIFDEDILIKLKQQVELLSTSNDILCLRLEGVTLRLDQQTEILNKFSEKLKEINFEKGRNVHVDVGANFPNKNDDHSSQCTAKYPSTCSRAAALSRKSGIYTIQVPTFTDESFLVYCNEDIQGGGWTVIQRRVDDTVDFYRDWGSYKIGFGNLEGNFFIGLDKLYAMTTEIPQELLIVMTDFDNVTKYAKYDSFAIGNESEMYALNVLGKYSGDAGDSLTYHQGYKFTTKDKENDINTSNCAVIFKGAWWYKNCHASNLNGLYLKGAYDKSQYAQGIDWNEWHGHYYSLKTVNMLIRPKRA